MSAVPPSAYAACKRHMTVARVQTSNAEDKSKHVSASKLMELSPVKYNSKLMNSIWGLYNKYSPHNFKKNTPENFKGSFVEARQNFASASAAMDKNSMAQFGSGLSFL